MFRATTLKTLIGKLLPEVKNFWYGNILLRENTMYYWSLTLI